jgi:hypothetical protein
MTGKNESVISKRVSEESPQAMKPVVKKPYQEPVLTRHEQLIENTHFELGGATGAVGP